MRNKIMQMIEDFKSKTGSYPDNIYLGKADWQSVQYELAQLEIYLQSKSNAMRPRCCGLWVYVVDAESHLAVG